MQGKQWNSLGAFILRPEEEIISAYITDKYGYIAATPNHFYAITNHGFSIPNDEELIKTPISYPDRGYVTNLGRLVIGSVVVDVCKERGFNGDFTDSRVIQKFIGKGFDIELAQKLCEEHNSRRELFYETNDKTISPNKSTDKNIYTICGEEMDIAGAPAVLIDSENLRFHNSIHGRRPSYKPEPGSGQKLPPAR